MTTTTTATAADPHAQIWAENARLHDLCRAMYAWRADRVGGPSRLVKDVAREHAASDREITRAYLRISADLRPNACEYQDLDAYVAAWRDALVKELRAHRAMVEYCLGKVLERRVKEAHNIDCLSTNGTRLQLGIGGILYTGANGINIGMNTTTYKSANTVLTVSGATTGSAQPLVKKTQTGAWDGNLALQFKGYANIVGDGSTTGLRINGEDTGNTIFQQGNNNLGITVNNASINSNTNGGNRMIITGTGRTYINPPLNVAGGAPFAVLMVLWQMEV